MKAIEIEKIINPTHPYLYAPTYAPTTLFLKDGTVKVGYFQHTDESDVLKKENIFTFVEFGENAQGFRATYDKKYVTKIKGDDILDVKYPPLITVKYDQVFKKNSNSTISPRIPVRIGGVTMGAGVSFGNGVLIGGVNLVDYINRNIQGYVDNGMLVIKSFS